MSSLSFLLQNSHAFSLRVFSLPPVRDTGVQAGSHFYLSLSFPLGPSLARCQDQQVILEAAKQQEVGLA